MSTSPRMALRERLSALSTRAKVVTAVTAAATTATLGTGLVASAAEGPHPAPAPPVAASTFEASNPATPTKAAEKASVGPASTALVAHGAARHLAAACDRVPVYHSKEMPFHDFSELDKRVNGDRVFRGHLFNPHERIIQHKATDGAAQPAEFDSALPARAAAIRQALAKGDKDVVQLYTFLQPGYSGAKQMDVLLAQLVKLKLATVGAKGKVKLLPGIQLMLDYEQPGLHPSVVTEASNRAHARAGQWPLIYASSSIMAPLTHAAPHDGLIVANYNGTASHPGAAVTAFRRNGKLMFQWFGGEDTGESLDRDVASGYSQNELRQSVGEKKVC